VCILDEREAKGSETLSSGNSLSNNIIFTVYSAD